jgi:hypothetical protein
MVKSSALNPNACHLCTTLSAAGRSQTLCRHGVVTTVLSGLPTGPHVLRGWTPPAGLVVLSRHSHLNGVHEGA